LACQLGGGRIAWLAELAILTGFHPSVSLR
jgi:hypothetical protein